MNYLNMRICGSGREIRASPFVVSLKGLVRAYNAESQCDQLLLAKPLQPHAFAIDGICCPELPFESHVVYRFLPAAPGFEAPIPT